MRYRIEYLGTCADETSVCYVAGARAGSLDHAGRMAHEGALRAQRLFGAQGFQIRDMAKAGLVVATHAFAAAPAH